MMPLRDRPIRRFRHRPLLSDRKVTEVSCAGPAPGVVVEAEEVAPWLPARVLGSARGSAPAAAPHALRRASGTRRRGPAPTVQRVTFLMGAQWRNSPVRR